MEKSTKNKPATRQEIIDFLFMHITNNSGDGEGITKTEENACNICLDLINLMATTPKEMDAAAKKHKKA